MMRHSGTPGVSEGGRRVSEGVSSAATTAYVPYGTALDVTAANAFPPTTDLKKAMQQEAEKRYLELRAKRERESQKVQQEKILEQQQEQLYQQQQQQQQEMGSRKGVNDNDDNNEKNDKNANATRGGRNRRV